MNADSGERAGTAVSIPTTVWLLGFVSLLMDVSSELIHSLLPVFLVTAAYPVGRLSAGHRCSRSASRC